MQKDRLKDFVTENRQAFDDQEPGPDVLQKIHARLGVEPVVEKATAKTIAFRYWWAAAAVVVLLAGAALFLTPPRQEEQLIAREAITESPAAKTGADTENDVQASVATTNNHIPAPVPKQSSIPERVHHKSAMEAPVAPQSVAHKTATNWRASLEQENFSDRLAAVLASGKENTVLSNSDLKALAHTMNYDENSNVRLAALEVLMKQEPRKEVQKLILESVGRQDDPVVQLDLLASLSPDEATTVKQQLFDIAQNPTNIEAVRSQAYAALLRSTSQF